MAALTEVFVEVKPDTDKFGPDLKKKLRRVDTKDAGHRMGMGLSKNLGGGFRAGIGGAARTMFAPIVAAAAAVGGFSLFKGFVEDAAESAKISRLTEQVIKSTGGAANVTAGQVNKLATAISNKTGVDDEAIQSGANLLLTFKNIRNEVGKGNDIFNQANQAVTDMSVALGQDTKSSAIQLGKALNDPIKGVTALQRVGVSFTKQQKEQIKTLVESGDVLGAQKLILKELGEEFGGAAEAAASPMDKLKVIVGNLGEEIGSKMLPFIEDAATWLGKHLPGALETVTAFMRAEVLPRLREFGDFFKVDILPVLKGFAGFIKDEVVPRLADLGGWISRNRDVVVPLVAALGTGVIVFKAVVAITKAWAAAQVILNAVLFANPIGLIIGAVAALAAGLVIAYNKSETFRDIVDGVFDFIADSVESMWNDFLEPTFDAFAAALEWIGDTAETLERTWDAVWSGIKSIFEDGIRFIVNGFFDLVDSILQGAEQAFGWVKGLGPKLDEAHDAFSRFRADVNRELGRISDERVNINVGYAVTGSGLPAGLTRGGRGGSGGRGGAGAFANIPARDIAVMGGDLDLETLGLNPKKIAGLATDFVNRTKAAITKAAKAAAAVIGPGAGRFVFPLPRGSYRVGVPLNGYPGHTGQDFPAPSGTPVFAPFSGYMLARNLGNRSYGRFADISSGAWRSIQAHLSGFARGSGPVRAGQLIGYVGSTGNSTGPHLHQEFRRSGAVINPRSVLSYDNGGMLPTGFSVVHNGTGQPEPVRPADLPMQLTDATIRKLGDAIGRVVVGGIGSAQHLSARSADLYSRGG